jgi:hypothetical protein
MRIERPKESVHLSHEELQKLVKDYMEKESGRTIIGEVLFCKEEAGSKYETRAFAQITFKDETK